jgi:hypothetical protein
VICGVATSRCEIEKLKSYFFRVPALAKELCRAGAKIVQNAFCLRMHKSLPLLRFFASCSVFALWRSMQSAKFGQDKQGRAIRRSF